MTGLKANGSGRWRDLVPWTEGNEEMVKMEINHKGNISMEGKKGEGRHECSVVHTAALWVQCSVVQCREVQSSAGQYRAVQYRVQHTSVESSTLQIAVQSAVQSAVQCSAVQSAVQFSAVQCSAVQCSEPRVRNRSRCPEHGFLAPAPDRSAPLDRLFTQCSAVQCSAVLCSVEQCSALQCTAVHCSSQSR
jgi:hypothetical protein